VASELLTHSRLRSFRACPRQHYYSYVQGYRPRREHPALAFGTAAHGCLETYWLARRDGADDPGARALAAMPREMDPFARARLETMLVGYVARWDAEDVEVLEVEVEFTLPLLNPATGHATPKFRLGGKIDLLLRERATGRVRIVEHKTTARDPGPGSEYRDALALDGQISQYFLGAEALGYAPDDCVYDVLVKPGLEPLQATPPEKRRYTKPTKKDPVARLYANQREHDETVDEYRERLFATLEEDPTRYVATIDVPRLEAERDEYHADVWDLAAEIRLSARTGRARRNPDACHRFGTPCPYLPVCQHRAAIDDPVLFEHAGPHPELTEAGRAA
jgi:hypothetical protein